jgi:ParB-like chromosome segregation protein Spo0J
MCIGIVGRLRYETARLAGLPDIECKIMRFKSDSERIAVQLAENLHRKELHSIQRSEWTKRYIEALRAEMPEASMGAIIKTAVETIEKLTGEKPREQFMTTCRLQNSFPRMSSPTLHSSAMLA